MTLCKQMEAMKGRCDLTVESLRDASGRTMWRVAATPRDEPEDAIIAESFDLTDAVRRVVGHAAVVGLLTESVRP